MNHPSISVRACWTLALSLLACDPRHDVAPAVDAASRATATDPAPATAAPSREPASGPSPTSDRTALAATPTTALAAAGSAAGAAPRDGVGPIAVPVATVPTALSASASAPSNGVAVLPQTYVHPPRTGDAKEDYWTQFELWGELTNHSSTVMESVSARIVFFDAGGRTLGIDSIASAAQQDAGDTAIGENVHAAVHFVAPGASVPFHYMRNLAAIDGEVASFALYPKGGLPASGPVPRATAVDLRDTLDGAPPVRKRLLGGTIRNDGEGGCRAPHFVIALLDADDRVRGLESLLTADDLTASIAKDESRPFDVRVFALAENDWKATAKIETWVDCQPSY